MVAGGDALYFQNVDELEESVFRASMTKKEVERLTRFGDLLSFGATRCIFTGVSPDGSVYVTVDHGGVEVYSVDLRLPEPTFTSSPPMDIAVPSVRFRLRHNPCEHYLASSIRR